MKGKHHLKDRGIDGRMILKYILKIEREDVDSIYLAHDRDHYKELSVFINDQLPSWLRDYQFFKTGSATRS
jgi:hypothetical protein